MENVRKENGEVVYFEIDRAKWLSGYEASQKSALLESESQKYCCLGIYGQACGIEDDLMRDIGSPGNHKVHELFPEWLKDVSRDEDGIVIDDTPFGHALMLVNDSKEIKDDTRERLLRYLFKSKGVTVAFTGYYTRSHFETKEQYQYYKCVALSGALLDVGVVEAEV